VPAWAFGPTADAAGRDSGSSTSGPLRVIGHLPEPAAHSVRRYSGHIVQVDAAHRRMFYAYTDNNLIDHIVTYDLRPRIPQPGASGVLGPDGGFTFSPFVDSIDSKRNHLLLTGSNIQAGGQQLTTGNPNITVFDVRRSGVLTTWDMEKILPGFFPIGMTYSRADDRIYLVGEFSGTVYGANSIFSFGSKAVGPGTAVVALTPDTGKLLWVRPVPQCQQVLNSLNIGGLIARSAIRPALYLPCVTGATPSGNTYPGQAGLLRLDIDPKADSTDQAVTFPVEFFPISGQYFNGSGEGIATFDYREDRFFLQSLAPKTPGAWVFDGKLSAWVGFVPAPNWTDQFAGYNQGLGHLYIGLYSGTNPPLSTDGTVVADGRQTPVQTGTFEPLVTGGFIPTDSGSNRLFALAADASTTLEPYKVIADRSPRQHPQSPLDYDALTDGVTEDAAAFVTYSADVNAYGADVALVGGMSGPLSVSGSLDIQPPVAGGTRGLMTARIGGLGLRPAGASASAQSVVADLNTTKDYQTSGPLGAWPYEVVSCLDSGGGIKPQSTDTNRSSAAVDCSLAKARSHGESDAAAVAAGPLRVGNSTTDATSWRDAVRGSRTSVDATSSGISVGVPGVGRLRVGSLSAHLTTRAHGMNGTAVASYQRSVDGVRIVDPHGKLLLGPVACSTTVTAAAGHKPTVHDSCGPLARAVNEITQTRLRLNFPLPQSIATPRGAYAAVQQSDSRFFEERTVNDQGVVFPHDSTAQRPSPAMQLELFNDTTERSRLLAQFAAVQGDAIFDTSAASATQQSPPPPGSVPGPKAPGVAPPATGTDGSVHLPGGATTTGAGQPPAVAANPVSGLTGWLLLHRSLRDALLLAGILALAAGAGLLAARRHQLLTAMTATTERPSA
jgi:hypothetical protein